MLQIDDYILESFLGKGTFGEVYLTKKANSNFLYATKRMEKALVEDPRYKKYFHNEISILKKLFHKNIIRIQDLKITTNHYYIIMEYCNGGSLTQCLKTYKEMFHHPFTEEIVQYLMRQIVSAVKFIHSQGIVHRDLKLDNILVNFNNENDKNNMNLLNAQTKIIDFGFASSKEDSPMFKTAIGSPLNMDPLILQKFYNGRAQTNDLQYDEKADIWSLGALCYQMLIGDFPFDAYNMQELVEKIEKGTYSVPTSLSREVVSFLNAMLQYNPKMRLTAENLSNHAFLTKNINDFTPINTNLVAKNVYGGQLNINIKNNQSIWAIFNEHNENFLNNIPGEFYTQEAPLSESVYINIPGKENGITSKPYDEEKDWLSTNFKSTDSIPIPVEENILKSGSTPIPPVNSGINLVQTGQKNISGVQFQYPQNFQNSPERMNMAYLQANAQGPVAGYNIPRQVNNLGVQLNPQNIQNRRPQSDKNINTINIYPQMNQNEFIKRQNTAQPQNDITQFNNNLRNINQGNVNLNQGQNGLQITTRGQLSYNEQQFQNNKIIPANAQMQVQNRLMPVQNNQIQLQKNQIPVPNNQLQTQNRDILSPNNPISAQNKQIQLPSNNQIQMQIQNRPPQLVYNQKQLPNNPMQMQNRQIPVQINNQIQNQNRVIQIPKNQLETQNRQPIVQKNPMVQANPNNLPKKVIIPPKSKKIIMVPKQQNINTNIAQVPIQKEVYQNPQYAQINPNNNFIHPIPNNNIHIAAMAKNNYENQTTPHKQIPPKANLIKNVDNLNQTLNTPGKIKVIKQTKYIIINQPSDKKFVIQDNPQMPNGRMKTVKSEKNLFRSKPFNPIAQEKLPVQPTPKKIIYKISSKSTRKVNNNPVKKILITPTQLQFGAFPQQQVLTQPNQVAFRRVGQAFQ